MPELIGYALLNTYNNSTNTSLLAKAQCCFCKRKYGSIEEASKCEIEHMRKEIFNGHYLFR